MLFFSAAIFIHLSVLLFGGLLFLKPPEEEAATEIAEVDIISDDSEKDEKKKDEEEVKKEAEETPSEEAMAAQDEAPPDMAELQAIAARRGRRRPRSLQALSLNALEGALAPSMTSGDFGWGVNLGSGGRIGGTGTAADAELAEAGGIFDAADLDQKPRTVFQVPPMYPAELRRKKAAGTVYVLFVVDQQGRVQDPKIESFARLRFRSSRHRRGEALALRAGLPKRPEGLVQDAPPHPLLSRELDPSPDAPTRATAGAPDPGDRPHQSRPRPPKANAPKAYGSPQCGEPRSRTQAKSALRARTIESACRGMGPSGARLGLRSVVPGTGRATAGPCGGSWDILRRPGQSTSPLC